MSSVTGFGELADEFEDFGEGLEDCAGDGIEDVGDEVAEETAEHVSGDASRFAPVDTGKLETSIFVWPMPVGDMQRLVVAATPYAKHVEYGTNPHVIPPSEETTYDKPIMHPGATPRPYMRAALWNNRRRMHREFEREIERLFRRNLD